MVNRKGSLSAFGRNFRFQLAQKHFSRISLSAERALTAKMLNFGRNTAISAEILLLFRPKEGPFGRKKTLSAETVLFRQFRLSAEIEDFGLPSFGFGRNSIGWPLQILIISFSKNKFRRKNCSSRSNGKISNGTFYRSKLWCSSNSFFHYEGIFTAV